MSKLCDFMDFVQCCVPVHKHGIGSPGQIVVIADIGPEDFIQICIMFFIVSQKYNESGMGEIDDIVIVICPFEFPEAKIQDIEGTEINGMIQAAVDPWINHGHSDFQKVFRNMINCAEPFQFPDPGGHSSKSIIFF